MDCVQFMVWLGSGVVIVPLLALMKQLPVVGPVIDEWAWILAPLLALILPKLATYGTAYCGLIDAKLWALIYAALAYLVSQLLYWLAKKWGVNV